MNMKLKIIALASATVLASGFASAHEHKPMLIDHGPLVTPELQAHVEALQARHNSLMKRAVEMANASGEPTIVDVAVVMHETWIESMKEPISKDANGKYYENGAQFALARVKASFDFFNEMLANQNVNARLRPVYFASVNHERKSITDSFSDFAVLVQCTNINKELRSEDPYTPFCEQKSLKELRGKILDNADVVYYIRNSIEQDSALGVGGFLSGGVVIDLYRGTIPHLVSTGASEDIVNSYRFGYYNANVFAHEFGHVFGAFHEISEASPDYGDDNRAYACGKLPESVGIPRVEGDLSTMKKTIMWHQAGDHHTFFSDSEKVVDGDRCGVVGVANNITHVRKNAPLAALNSDMPALTSAVSFVDTAVAFDRKLGKASLVLRRTGDLTQPAYLSITAQDGSAWENRDFTFGLQEVTFAAGEAEKTVEVTLLPRTEGHANTKFNVVIQAAIGASYPTSNVEVTILSDKLAQPGELSFANAQTDVFEGATAQVTVNRTSGLDGDITFKVTPVNGTAVKGTDFNVETVVKTLKNGESSLVIDVPTTKRAGTQGSRNFTLNISEVSGGANVGSVGQTTVTIKDVVESGSLAFNSATVNVNENSSATLTINRTNGTDGDVTVRVQTLNGTAVSGTDFTAVDQVVTIPAGQSSASVVVTTLNRSGEQGSRYFDVQLSNVTGGAVLGSNVTTRVNIADVVTTPPAESGSSGGSVGLYSLLGMLLLAVRRIKLSK